MGKIMVSVLVPNEIDDENTKDIISQIMPLIQINSLSKVLVLFLHSKSYEKYGHVFSSLSPLFESSTFDRSSFSSISDSEGKVEIEYYFSGLTATFYELKKNDCERALIYNYVPKGEALNHFDLSLPSDYLYLKYSRFSDVGYDNEILYCNHKILSELVDYKKNLVDFFSLVNRKKSIPWPNFYSKSVFEKKTIFFLEALEKYLKSVTKLSDITPKVLRRVKNKLDLFSVTGETSLPPSVNVDQILPEIKLNYFLKYHISLKKLREKVRFVSDGDFLNLIQTRFEIWSVRKLSFEPLEKYRQFNRTLKFDSLGYVIFTDASMTSDVESLFRYILIYMHANGLMKFDNNSFNNNEYFGFILLEPGFSFDEDFIVVHKDFIENDETLPCQSLR